MVSGEAANAAFGNEYPVLGQSMSNDSLPDTPDKAIQHFIAIPAFGFGFEGAVLILQQNFKLGVVGLICCALLSWIGYKWSSIKGILGNRTLSIISEIVNNPRYWIAALFLLLVILPVIALFPPENHATLPKAPPQSESTLTLERSIIDPEQLTAAVKRFAPSVRELYYAASEGDDEASQYLTQFLNVFRGTPIKPIPLSEFFFTCTTKTHGIFIGVLDAVRPTQAAKDFKEALIKGGITPEPSFETIATGNVVCRQGMAFVSATHNPPVNDKTIWLVIGHNPSMPDPSYMQQGNPLESSIPSSVPSLYLSPLIWKLAAIAVIAIGALLLLLKLPRALHRPRWHIMDGLIYEYFSGHSSGSAHSCFVEISNGNRTLKNCRIKLDDQLICEPFTLLPGDKKHVPIIRVSLNSDTLAAVYSYYQSDGKWQRNHSAVRLIGDGDYQLKLIAEDLYPPLEMTVNVSKDSSLAAGWEMKEAGN